MPSSFSDALRKLADEVERREQAEKLSKELSAAREADKPKVDFVDRYVDTAGTLSLSDAARTLGYSSPAMFTKALNDCGILFRNVKGENVAYAAHRTAGYFVQRTGYKGAASWVHTRVTPRGLEWLARQFAQKAA